jgi:16S rRNA U1498 N3-methylase RsmE
MLNPQQKQVAQMFQGKNDKDKCEAIAQKCNEMGINKEQLEQIFSMFK